MLIIIIIAGSIDSDKYEFKSLVHQKASRRKLERHEYLLTYEYVLKWGVL